MMVFIGKLFVTGQRQADTYPICNSQLLCHPLQLSISAGYLFFFRYKPYDDDDNDFCDLALRYCYFCGALLPTLVMPPVQPIDLRFFFFFRHQYAKRLLT